MGAYADLSSLGDSAVPGRAKWLVNTVAFLVVLTVGGFAISGWYMYTLKVKYDDFNRNFNGESNKGCWWSFGCISLYLFVSSESKELRENYIMYHKQGIGVKQLIAST